jgi:hypothetical protein
MRVVLKSKLLPIFCQFACAAMPALAYNPPAMIHAQRAVSPKPAAAQPAPQQAQPVQQAAATVPVTQTNTTNTYVPETNATTTTSSTYNVEVPPAAANANDQLVLAGLIAERDQLTRQLLDIRAENSRCEKQKTGWKVATVIGSVGVAATAAGAIYQGVDWKKKHAELDKINSDLTTTKADIQKIEQTTDTSAGGN